MLISASVKGHALLGLLPLSCFLSCFCFAFKASRVKLNDTSFIPVPNLAMIECPYFVRWSFLSTLLMIERKVHGSKSPPYFFLTVKRKLAWSGSNSFGGINRKFVQPSPHHAVSFSLCSCFFGHLWTVGYHVLTCLSNFHQILGELLFIRWWTRSFILKITY